MKKSFIALLLILTFYSPVNPETLDLVTFDYYPTMYRKGNEIKGCCVLIVKEACKRMGYNVTISMVPYQRGLFMIREGKADGMFTVYKTPEREGFAFYPELPVMPLHLSIPEIFLQLRYVTHRTGTDHLKVTAIPHHYSPGVFAPAQQAG